MTLSELLDQPNADGWIAEASKEELVKILAEDDREAYESMGFKDVVGDLVLYLTNGCTGYNHMDSIELKAEVHERLEAARD